MPIMSDHEEFLNSTMLEENDIVVLLNEGEFREPEDTGLQRTVFQISVGLPDQRTKTWTMNKTTRKRLIEAWGDDSANWVNKKVQIKMTMQNVRGEMRTVLWGYPVDKDPTPKQNNKTKQAKIKSPKKKADEIIAKIRETKPDMTPSKISELIETEIKNSGGAFDEHVAAVLVARSLGIDMEQTGEIVA